ncbi:SDR family NAD(P)-dependent oxidoreductase [Arsukibacterium sp.]|uniref:SDR family NAD(P)-dependent oxidoreductase n=1 Tax=Arsukibacterium sp. TaxID=1977258 RepID=UPI002FDADEF0
MHTKQHWLILGASGAIAQGLIQHYLAHGAKISAISRQAQPSELIADELTWYQQPELEPEVISRLLQHIGAVPLTGVIGCHGWLHGEGAFPEKAIAQLQQAQLEISLQINLITPAIYLQCLMPLLMKQPGIKIALLSAKVGSISDNQLGGWYSYRMAKAALNMLVKTAAIELGRRNKTAVMVSLHPGTTDSALSEPFQANVPSTQLQSPQQTAQRLAAVLQQLNPAQTGQLLNWDGSTLPF